MRWYTLGRYNHRTHRKWLIIDGRIAFTGGAGIADKWLGHAQDLDHWRDIQFRLEGPAVTVAGRSNDQWISRHNSVRHYGLLLEAGTEILEFHETLLHQAAEVVRLAVAQATTQLAEVVVADREDPVSDR